MNAMESHNDGNASSKPASQQSISSSATETIVELSIEAGVAGGHTVIELPHLGYSHLASSCVAV